jgi:hypothetical protein
VHGSGIELLEDASALEEVLSASLSPRDVLRILLIEDANALSIDNKVVLFKANLSSETAMDSVIAQLVEHVVRGNERVIDGRDRNTFLDAGTEN